ncbi:MAG: alpha/beta hydrolase [Sphingobium sp.]
MPLVILPGLICDSSMFGAPLAAFPGSMVVEGFYGGADRIEAMADYALDRIPDRCAVIGHSMGARVALEIMRKAPERVERLALVDTGVHPVKPGERDARYRLRDLGRAQGMVALVDQWLPPMVGANALGEEGLMARLHAMAVVAGLATFEAQIEALLHRPSVDTLLPMITCPTFAIVGQDDQWSPVEQHRQIAAVIPGAQLRVIAGAGHMMPAEAPEAFNRAISEWLDWPTTQ